MAHKKHSRACTHASSGKCRCEEVNYWRGLYIALAIFAIEIVGGLLAGSIALLADSAHVLSDAAGYGISIYVARMAGSHSDEDSFRRRYSRISGALLLIILAVVICGALLRLVNPDHIVEGQTLTIFSLLGAFGNALQLLLIRRTSNNSTSRIQYLHILTDLLGSLIALFAGMLIWLTDYSVIDPWLSIVLATVLSIVTIREMREGHTHQH